MPKKCLKLVYNKKVYHQWIHFSFIRTTFLLLKLDNLKIFADTSLKFVLVVMNFPPIVLIKEVEAHCS